MKLLELFDTKHDGVVDNGPDYFAVTKTIGDRVIEFYAEKDRAWEVTFAQRDDEGRPIYAMTGDGDEVKLLSFIMHAFQDFVKAKQPKRIEFSSKSSEASRISLYKRLIKRFAKDYYVQEFPKVGMGSQEKYDVFTLTLKEDEIPGSKKSAQF